MNTNPRRIPRKALAVLAVGVVTAIALQMAPPRPAAIALDKAEAGAEIYGPKIPQLIEFEIEAEATCLDRLSPLRDRILYAQRVGVSTEFYSTFEYALCIGREKHVLEESARLAGTLEVPPIEPAQETAKPAQRAANKHQPAETSICRGRMTRDGCQQ